MGLKLLKIEIYVRRYEALRMVFRRIETVKFHRMTSAVDPIGPLSRLTAPQLARED